MAFVSPFQTVFRPVFGGGAAAAGNGLLNALIAYWPGNEANGDALDAHTNALHLTDVNTVTSNPGIVYATARHYTAVNGEYHARAGDDALLSTGDIDFTGATWARFDSAPGVGYWVVMTKRDASNGTSEYALNWNGPINRIRAALWNGAAVLVGAVSADSVGVPAIGVWYLIVWWHDSITNTVNIQVNNGVVDSAATTGAVGDSTASFAIGGLSDATLFMDGRIGPTMFWKSAAGGGGVLSAAQRTALYNGGAGLTYAQFTT